MNTRLEYKGYEIEIIRGKRETLVIALKDDYQLTARAENAKVALADVKVKIDEKEAKS